MDRGMQDSVSCIEENLLEIQSWPIPDLTRPFTVYTASSIGLGAVLEQECHVVTYASRVLTKPEQQYSVIQQECLAVVYTLKHAVSLLPLGEIL